MDWITICITGKRLADSGFFFGGGGGRVLTKVLYGEAPPLGPAPYPFIFDF